LRRALAADCWLLALVQAVWVEKKTSNAIVVSRNPIHPRAVNANVIVIPRELMLYRRVPTVRVHMPVTSRVTNTISNARNITLPCRKAKTEHHSLGMISFHLLDGYLSS
jgi:hypothetical protein